MKKLITLLMAALLSVSLCSCGQNAPDTVQPQDSAVEDVSKPATEDTKTDTENKAETESTNLENTDTEEKSEEE